MQQTAPAQSRSSNGHAKNGHAKSGHAKTVHVSAERIAFAGETLFEDLEFVLPGGQWTCILGPSGVGKSTLLRLIAGLVRVEGRCAVRCGDGAALDGRAAFMAQQDLLLPWLSLSENVLLGPRLRRARDAEARARAHDLLETVGLGGDGGLLPAQCSGGMRQRAALARTLIEDRPIVLMDEPFSALDSITRVRIQDLAVALLDGKTVLLVTHDPMEALRLGHHIHVMAHRPARLGPPISLEGERPRESGDGRLQARYRDLLRRLIEASGGP